MHRSHGKPAAFAAYYGLSAEDRRRELLRELDLHGGSPAAAARSLGIPLATLQRHVTELGLRGAAKRARDRWERMFRVGGNDPEG